MGGISLTRVQCEKIMAKTEKSVEDTGVSATTEAKDPVVSTTEAKAPSKKKHTFRLLAGKHSVSDEVRLVKGDLVESDDDLVTLHGKEKFEYVVK
jgi:hypothetical protein